MYEEIRPQVEHYKGALSSPENQFPWDPVATHRSRHRNNDTISGGAGWEETSERSKGKQTANRVSFFRSFSTRESTVGNLFSKAEEL